MIIGISGFANSGKGTVADILVNNYHFQKFSFADAVKDATMVIFGWPRNLLEGNTEESRIFRETPDEYWSRKFNKPFTPRLAMQIMGTEACRNSYHPDIWIHVLEKRIRHFGGNIVIADVRFPNEMKFIRDQNGMCVRVKRGNEPPWYETAYKENTTHEDEHWILMDNNELMSQRFPEVHESEWKWIGPHFDFIIHNNSDIETLRNNIHHMMQVFRGPPDIEKA